MKNCDNCKHAETPAFFEPCASCGGSSYWEPYVQTNADRIRAMNDKELAYWCYRITTDAMSVLQIGNNRQMRSCLEWLDWLKQEAKT